MYTFFSRTSTVSPGSPITRLMKSRSGSSGYLKTMTSVRRTSAIGSSAALEPGHGRAGDELVDEQMIADEQVVFHRSGRDLERLHDERADEQRQHDRGDDRLEVLANGGFLEVAHHQAFSFSFQLPASHALEAGSSELTAIPYRSPSSARRETLPAGSGPCRPASSASCLPSASRAACACARCRRRSTWRARSCASPSPTRGR